MESRQVTIRGTTPVPGWVRGSLWFGLGAVLLYVGGWIVAGQLRDGYDPREQAISELFELGAPWASRGLLLVGLVLSGIAFLLLAPALQRALPGRGLLGPALVVVAGIGTLGVVAAPCSAGCPGTEASTTDTWHAITAGGGYSALVLAPLAFAWRVRGAAPRLAIWSVIIGGTGGLLFVVYAFGLIDAVPGLQQRLFNTIADGWYVVVAIWVLRRDATARAASGSPRATAADRGRQTYRGARSSRGDAGRSVDSTGVVAPHPRQATSSVRGPAMRPTRAVVVPSARARSSTRRSRTSQ